MTARLTTSISAIPGKFGSRVTTFTTQITPEDIEGVLGYDPRSRFWRKLPSDLEHLYAHLQRVTKPERLRAITSYIETRFSDEPIILGAFPAVSIGVQNPVRWESIPDGGGAVRAHFDLSGRNRRVVFDGLARISGIIETLDRSTDPNIDPEVREQLVKTLANITIPVVFYTPSDETAKSDGPLSLDEMQQLFHDFNFRATSITGAHAISLDHSDPYIQLANRIGRHCAAIQDHGGFEEKAASLGAKSTALVVQTNLVRMVRGATEGAAFQEGNRSTVETPNLTAQTFAATFDGISAYLNAFSEAMGDDWTNRNLLHLSAPGWQSIGVIYYEAIRRGINPTTLAERLAEVEWERESKVWEPIMTIKEKDGQTTPVLSGAGAGNRRFMISYLREHLGLVDPVAQAA